MHTMLWTPWTGCKCDLSGIQSFYCLCWTKVSFRLRNSSSATFTQYGAVGRQPRMKYATKMESIGEEPGTATSVKSVVCWYPGGLHPSAPFSSKRKLWQWRVTDSWSGSTLTSDWTVVCSCLQGIMIWQHPDHIIVTWSAVFGWGKSLGTDLQAHFNQSVKDFMMQQMTLVNGTQGMSCCISLCLPWDCSSHVPPLPKATFQLFFFPHIFLQQISKSSWTGTDRYPISHYCYAKEPPS